MRYFKALIWEPEDGREDRYITETVGIDRVNYARYLSGEAGSIEMLVKDGDTRSVMIGNIVQLEERFSLFRPD